MNTLYILRHGQTEWNAEGRMQGRLDSPLTDVGREQANAAGRALKKVARLDSMIVSPSGRTRETAYIVNSFVRAPISYEPALQERDCGQWSGLTVADVEARFPRAWQARLDDPYGFRPPDGENLADMLGRVRGFLDSLYEAPAGELALVTHGVMSRVIVSHFLALSPMQAVRVHHPNDLVYRLEFRPKEVSASHFRGGEGPFTGLLHKNEGETIASFDDRNER